MRILLIVPIIMLVFAGILAGCDTATPLQNCTPTVCPAPQPCPATQCAARPAPVVCPVPNNTVTYVNNTVYVNATSLEKAMWYLDVAHEESDGYYDDYLAMKYTDCANKLRYSYGYVDTAIALLKLVTTNQTADNATVVAYQAYSNAQRTIFDYCNGRNDGQGNSAQVTSDYNSYYYQYKYTLMSLDKRLIFKQ